MLEILLICLAWILYWFCLLSDLLWKQLWWIFMKMIRWKYQIWTYIQLFFFGQRFDWVKKLIMCRMTISYHSYCAFICFSSWSNTNWYKPKIFCMLSLWVGTLSELFKRYDRLIWIIELLKGFDLCGTVWQCIRIHCLILQYLLKY